jgi:Multisubunit Na+/H+ antiporter, MnhB subunit
MSGKNFFTGWVEGEKPVPLHAEFEPIEEKKAKKKRPASLSDRQKLDGFLRIYARCGIAISAVLLIVLLIGAVAMPEFAAPGNPTDNEVVHRYVGSAEHETGAENVIAGMILNYRGFDTFGESCVLFLAVCCVMLLLWATNDKIKAEARACEKTAPRDAILANVAKLLLPCVLCFGICVLLNGHISPGGGFSGGSILGAALILFAVSFGSEAVHRFFTAKVFNAVRITGLMIYACMFGVYIYQGANQVQSDLARYIVLVIDLAVGLVVMSTMYGFYSFYTKGEL